MDDLDDAEAEHAELLKLDRLEWLRDTTTTLYAREVAEPGSVPNFAVMALHSSMHSWVKNVLRLDVPS